MESLKTRIEALTQEIKAIQPANKEELEAFRIKFLGTKGILKDVFAAMKDVPVESKKRSRAVAECF